MTMVRLLINADDAVTHCFQEAENLTPASRVVPVFALGCALNSNADIRLGDRSGVVIERNARRNFCRIDAENIARGAMHPDVTEVRRLIHEDLVVAEQPNAVCQIKYFHYRDHEAGSATVPPSPGTEREHHH